MKALIPAFALLAAACGSNSTPPPTPAPAPTAAPAPEPELELPETSGPEIVELPIPADEMPPDDCVAAGVDGGVLDETSDAYKRIEVKRHKQFVRQKATLADGSRVDAQVGGCAHHGAGYVVVLERSKPVSDRAHYLGAALDVLGKLPLRAGSDHFTKEIAEEIRPALGDPAKLETCDFPRGEMDRVMCGVAEETDGAIHVNLAYDIAL